jgi:hypothetical protein
MKLSKSGGLTILAVFCLSVGILIGQYTIQKAVNIESMREATLFSVHAAYLRGCVESNPGNWDKCVEGAINNTSDTREILTKEPERMFNPPLVPQESNLEPINPSLEDLIDQGETGIMI